MSGDVGETIQLEPIPEDLKRKVCALRQRFDTLISSSSITESEFWIDGRQGGLFDILRRFDDNAEKFGIGEYEKRTIDTLLISTGLLIADMKVAEPEEVSKKRLDIRRNFDLAIKFLTEKVGGCQTAQIPQKGDVKNPVLINNAILLSYNLVEELMDLKKDIELCMQYKDNAAALTGFAMITLPKIKIVQQEYQNLISILVEDFPNLKNYVGEKEKQVLPLLEQILGCFSKISTGINDIDRVMENTRSEFKTFCLSIVQQIIDSAGERQKS